MNKIASPCVNVCALDAAGETCTGCGRTRDEIGRWIFMSDEERAAVMDRLAREKALSPRSC